MGPTIGNERSKNSVLKDGIEGPKIDKAFIAKAARILPYPFKYTAHRIPQIHSDIVDRCGDECIRCTVYDIMGHVSTLCFVVPTSDSINKSAKSSAENISNVPIITVWC
jgi:hypothetical protein